MFVKKIEETIREYKMISAGDKVVAGVSGGADSVCLFHVLGMLREKLDFSLYVIHVHHSIRGGEADRDAEFVRSLCEAQGIPCRIYKYDVPAFAAENRLSVEEAGRILRREAFEKYANEVGHAKIALAHHMNDVAETVLFNMARGSGLAGLGSLKPVRESCIRPLLFTGREEITGWLSENNIRFCTDSTNADNTYSRNFIRNRILPEMTEGVNRRSIRHLCEISLVAGEAEEFITSCATKCFNKYTKRISKEELFLPGRMFQDESPYIAARTVKLALCILADTSRDIARVHIKAVCALSGAENGRKTDLPYGLCAESVYGDIRLTRMSKEGAMPSGSGPVLETALETGCSAYFGDLRIYADLQEVRGEYGVTYDNRRTSEAFCIEEIGKSGAFGREFIGEFDDTYSGKAQNSCTKKFDYDKINGMLKIRYRMAGDYLVIHPDGRKKSLSDYFTDSKVPRHLRDAIPLLACGSEILWVIGYRTGESCRIDEGTKQVLTVTAVSGMT